MGAIQFRKPPLIALAIFAISAGHLIVNRRNEKLTAIPTDINPDVTILQLEYNDVTHIEEGDLGSLVWLQVLYIGHNKINFISQAAFINNTKLGKIVMSHYTLPEFPLAFVGLWPSIVYLDIKNGELITQTVILARFPLLQRFAINDVKIKLEMGHLPSLKKMYAQRCALDTFPNLSGAPGLEWVQLHNNNFTEVPQSALMGLKNLARLNFPGNRVSYIPDLSHLMSLEMLKADENYIISFPDLYHLPLTTLTLSNNPLLCDKTLCWIRMWDMMKPVIEMSEITCAYPHKHMGFTLMSIHPTEMHCYEGNIRFSHCVVYQHFY